MDTMNLASAAPSRLRATYTILTRNAYGPRWDGDNGWRLYADGMDKRTADASVKHLTETGRELAEVRVYEMRPTLVRKVNLAPWHERQLGAQ